MHETRVPWRDLLRLRDFRWIYGGQIVSDLGDSLTLLSLLILVQQLGGSKLHLAGVVIAATIPALVIGLLSGVYVDRWNRHKIMIWSDMLRALLVLGFVFVRDLDLIWLLYMLVFAQAGIGTMFKPARSALIAKVVPDDSLLAANSVSHRSRVVFSVLGTALAGLIVGVTGTVWPAFVVDAFTFGLSALLITRVGSRSTERRTDTADTAVWADLKEGLKLLTSSRGMRGLLLAASVAMLGLGAINVLFVPLVIEDLQASTAWFGAIEASQVIGMVRAGAVVAIISKRLRINTMMGASLGVVGGAIAVLSQVVFPWQMMNVLFIAGLGITPLQAGAATLAQTLVEPSLIGRSSAALNSAISASSIVSMGLAGVFATAVGVRNVFVISGVITIVAGIVAYGLLAGVTTASVRDPAPDPERVPV